MLGVLICLPILVTFGVLLIHWYIHLYKYKSLGKFPGPKPLPILGNVLEFAADGLNGVLKNFERLTAEHGDLFTLYLGHTVALVTSNPVHIQTFLGSSVHINKSSFYKFFKDFIGKGLVILRGDTWRQHRRLFTPTFHFKILEEFSNVIDEAGLKLIEKLKKTEGTTIDIYKYVNLGALHIICETAMGINFNENVDEHLNYVELADKYLQIATNRAFSYKRSDTLFKLSPDSKLSAKYLKGLKAYTNEVILKRVEERKTQKRENTVDEFGIKKRMAFLDVLLDLNNDEDVLSYDDIRHEVDTFMFAGHDTISTSLGFLLYELSKHPGIQQKLYDEITSELGEDIKVTLNNMNNLKYSECVIKEGMRLYPTIPFIERVIENDITFEDSKIPKGTNVTIMIYALHRSEELYPNVYKFDPERFNSKNSSKRHPYAFIPFSAGPRNCIGQKFAMLEMKSLLTKIIKNFHITRPDPNFEQQLTTNGVLKSVNGWPVELKSRK